MRVRHVLSPMFVLVLAMGAAFVCVNTPPQIAFEPRPLLGFAAILAGTAAAVWPGSRPIIAAMRGAGAGTLWLTVIWCLLSQPISFADAVGIVQVRRTLPVLALATVWLVLWLSRSWQRRVAAAVFVPSIAGLALAGWLNVPQTTNFQPDRVAVDSHGTLYVTDLDASVIRVFGADGGLRAKLWPGLASLQGPPGPGFSPIGPYGDPERLGLAPGLIPGTSTASTVGSVAWSPRTDPFQFCGLAVDAFDRLYVPDPKHGVMLRFGADGALQARWPFPADFQPSPDCVAAAGDTVYLVDGRGAILAVSPAGEPVARWTLPDAIGGVSITPDGRRIYALSITQIFAVDVHSGAVAAWPLAAPSGGIVVLPSGRVVVGNHLDSVLDVYCADGQVCGHMGAAGPSPGQFWQLGGLAIDHDGRLYVADLGYRVVQAFSPSGHISAVYWSIEDDQDRIGRRV